MQEQDHFLLRAGGKQAVFLVGPEGLDFSIDALEGLTVELALAGSRTRMHIRTPLRGSRSDRFGIARVPNTVEIDAVSPYDASGLLFRTVPVSLEQQAVLLVGHRDLVWLAIKIVTLVPNAGGSSIVHLHYRVVGNFDNLSSALANLASEGHRLDGDLVHVLQARANDNEASVLLPAPAPLPDQKLGPYFEVVDNIISLAHPSAVVGAGDTHRLLTFRPLIVDALEELLDATPGTLDGSKGNSPFFRLARHAQRYLGEVRRDIEAIDYALLFGIGTMLQNRLAEDSFESEDVPKLSGRQRAALKDFQTHHGLFITASTEGLRALREADGVELSVSDETAFRRSFDQLLTNVTQIPALATPEVLGILDDVAQETGRGKFSERTAHFGHNTARNFLIVLCAYATVGAAAAIGTSVAGPAGTAVFGGPALLVVQEALKKSRAFQELSEPLTNAIDRVKGAKLHKFIAEHKDALEKVAGHRSEMQWLRDYLDWLTDMREHSED